MPRRLLLVPLALSVTLVGCNAVASIAGGPTIDEVTVQAPAGILVGDSAEARAVAKKSNGNIQNDVAATWRSSDPTVISVNAQGLLKGLIAGRQATIYADYGGKTGSAIVSVGSDDRRFAYALADQPSAPGPYAPDPSYRFNSTNSAISVTRASDGVYTVRFAGLGRPAGGHDNVQVTGYGGAAANYCKPQEWDASGADLVVPVNCFFADGTPTDSKFTILVIGAHALGASTPLGFLLSLGDTGTVVLDSSAAARNSAGGHVFVGHANEGTYSIQFAGLGAQSGGAAGPVGLLVSPVGQGLRHCRLAAYVLEQGALSVICTRLAGALGDSPFSLLWFTHGRPGLRYGYAFADQLGSIAGYQAVSALSATSSGGAVTARRTGAGTYQVVFGGLARPAGATEIALVSAFGGNDCTVASWANSGANDLAVNVACWDRTGAASNAQFNILVVQ